jgi:hypothetical protein
VAASPEPNPGSPRMVQDRARFPALAEIARSSLFSSALLGACPARSRRVLCVENRHEASRAEILTGSCTVRSHRQSRTTTASRSRPTRVPQATTCLSTGVHPIPPSPAIARHLPPSGENPGSAASPMLVGRRGNLRPHPKRGEGCRVCRSLCLDLLPNASERSPAFPFYMEAAAALAAEEAESDDYCEPEPEDAPASKRSPAVSRRIPRLPARICPAYRPAGAGGGAGAERQGRRKRQPVSAQGCTPSRRIPRPPATSRESLPRVPTSQSRRRSRDRRTRTPKAPRRIPRSPAISRENVPRAHGHTFTPATQRRSLPGTPAVARDRARFPLWPKLCDCLCFPLRSSVSSVLKIDTKPVEQESSPEAAPRRGRPKAFLAAADDGTLRAKKNKDQLMKRFLRRPPAGILSA